MSLPMPYGGSEIAMNRSAGKRPADMVLVSMIGPLGEKNPVVVAKPGRSYDWRFLVGLDVLVVADSKTDKPSVRRVLDGLLALPTEYLGVWIADRNNGFNVAWGSVIVRPRGLLRHMFADQRASLSGLGVPCT
jgi:hypothetical protein